jgi:HupE / UreJ protein
MNSGAKTHERRRRFLLWTCALASTLLLLCGPPASDAHELGLTRVTVTFSPAGKYQVDILVDPESLLAKLEIGAGRSPSTGVPLNELAARITELAGVVLARTQVVFDTARVDPVFEYIPGQPVAPGTPGVPPGTASTATVRLSGDVPSGARSFQFQYGLVLGSYSLTLVDAAGRTHATSWVAGGELTEPVDLTRGLTESSGVVVAARYVKLGFEHILPKGVDHIVFVLGLFLLSTAWRPLLLQVTMFTVAHSITLGLAMYGVVSLPSTIVEPLIALSITYVAVENLLTSTLRPWRAVLVFGFGLLHGLGFAGVLAELGLPRSQFLTALLAFNAGVEAGQLAVIALAFLAVGWWRRSRSAGYRRWVVVPASLAIATMGAYWTMARIGL